MAVVFYDEVKERNTDDSKTDSVSEQKLINYSYKISFMAYSPTTKWSLELNKYIYQLNIFNDFDNLFIPICAVDFIFNDKVLNQLDKNRETMQFILKFSITSDDGKVSNETICSPIKMSPLELPDFTVYEANAKRNDTPDTMMTIEFFKTEHLELISKITNKCYTDATIGGVLTSLLTMNKVKNAVVDTPDNSETYRNILIPPLNFNASVKYLDTKYKIFNSGMLLFHDYWSTWLLDYQFRECAIPKRYKYNNIEFINIEIVQENNPTTKEEGTYFGSEQNTVNIRTTKRPEIKNSRSVISQTSGSEVVMVNLDNDGHTTEKISMMDSLKGSVSSVINNIPKVKTKFKVNYSSKKGISSSIRTDILKNSKNVELYLRNIDIRLLLPVTQLTIDLNADKKSVDISTDEKYLLNKTILKFYKITQESDIFEMNATLLCDLQIVETE